MVVMMMMMIMMIVIVIIIIIISKSLGKYSSDMSGKHEIKELHKTHPYLATANTHTAGSANVKVQNTFHGRNNITCSTDCKYRTAATCVP